MFNGISTFEGYLMLSCLCRRLEVVLFSQALGNTEVRIFPLGICPKVNVIAWLEFELAYNDVTAQHVSHNIMEPLSIR